MVRVSVEGFDVPKMIPRMVALSDGLVGYKVMGGLGCEEVCIAIVFDMLHA